MFQLRLLTRHFTGEYGVWSIKYEVISTLSLVTRLPGFDLYFLFIVIQVKKIIISEYKKVFYTVSAVTLRKRDGCYERNNQLKFTNNYKSLVIKVSWGLKCTKMSLHLR